MPFCGECGTKYEAGSAFCPNCGARTGENTVQPEYSAQQNVPYGTPGGGKKERKSSGAMKLLPVILGSVAALALVCVLIFTGAFQSKSAKFRNIQNNFLFEPLAEITGEAAGASDASDIRFADTLTITGSFTGQGSDETVQALLEDSSLEIKADIDGAKESFACEMNLILQDNPLISVLLKKLQDEITLYVPAVDDEVYTLNLPDFIENNEDLLPEGVSVATDGASGLLGDLSDKQVKALVRRYAGILLSVVNRKNTVVKTEQIELLDSGETIRCKVYTVTPTEKDYRAMFETAYETMVDDEDLRAAALAVYKVQNMSYMDAAEIEDEFDDVWESFLDNFEDRYADVAEQLADQETTWQTAVKGKRIHMQTIFADYGQSIRYESAGATLKSRSDAILLLADEDNIQFALRNEYTRSGKEIDGKLAVESELSYYSDAEFTFTYAFDLAKHSSLGVPYGDYTFKYPDAELKVTAAVEAGDEGDDHAFVVSVDGYKIDLNVASAGKAPKIDAPKGSSTDLTDYSSDEIADLASEWANSLSSVFYEVVYGLM